MANGALAVPAALVVLAVLAVLGGAVSGCGVIGSATGVNRASPRVSVVRQGADAGGGIPITSFLPAEVITQRLVLADGSVLTAAQFAGGVRFVLHCGPVDPGCPAADHLRAGPSVSQSERPYLVAAFNGGFQQGAGAGGVVQEGNVLRPLVPGMASLVIYKSGAADIGTWGPGFPADPAQVYSVRQNLGPLVSGGQPTPAAADPSPRLWGATIGGGASVARSALGLNAAGQFIYVASMHATPEDLAQALVQMGARTGMQLDINPEWVQFDYASQAGGPLQAGLPGQNRPADQYLTGWSRDFIAVLATSLPGPPAAGTGSAAGAGLVAGG